MQDSLKVQSSQKTPDILKLQESPKEGAKVQVVAKPPEPAKPSDYAMPAAKDQAVKTDTKTETNPAADEAQTVAAESTHHAYEPPTVQDSLKVPLLAIAAVFASLVAGWNYSERQTLLGAVEEAQAKVTTATEAKATADKALAEAKAKLTVEQTARAVAEKAVADVKAALAMTAPTASTSNAAAPADASKTAAPAAAATTPAKPQQK